MSQSGKTIGTGEQREFHHAARLNNNSVTFDLHIWKSYEMLSLAHVHGIVINCQYIYSASRQHFE